MSAQTAAVRIMDTLGEFPDERQVAIVTDLIEQETAAGELLAACKKFMAALEAGTLVRDISADGSPDFTVKMMRFVSDLNAAQLAIAQAEGKV